MPCTKWYLKCFDVLYRHVVWENCKKLEFCKLVSMASLWTFRAPPKIHQNLRNKLIFCSSLWKSAKWSRSVCYTIYFNSRQVLVTIFLCQVITLCLLNLEFLLYFLDLIINSLPFIYFSQIFISLTWHIQLCSLFLDKLLL